MEDGTVTATMSVVYLWNCFIGAVGSMWGRRENTISSGFEHRKWGTYEARENDI
jgi:hypothetical protein